MPASLSSPFLSERLIARLSPQRRANLERRIREEMDALRLPERDADGFEFRREDMEHAGRCYNMLGRLSALTA